MNISSMIKHSNPENKFIFYGVDFNKSKDRVDNKIDNEINKNNKTIDEKIGRLNDKVERIDKEIDEIKNNIENTKQRRLSIISIVISGICAFFTALPILKQLIIFFKN